MGGSKIARVCEDLDALINQLQDNWEKMFNAPISYVGASKLVAQRARGENSSVLDKIFEDL